MFTKMATFQEGLDTIVGVKENPALKNKLTDVFHTAMTAPVDFPERFKQFDAQLTDILGKQEEIREPVFDLASAHAMVQMDGCPNDKRLKLSSAIYECRMRYTAN